MTETYPRPTGGWTASPPPHEAAGSPGVAVPASSSSSSSLAFVARLAARKVAQLVAEVPVSPCSEQAIGEAANAVAEIEHSLYHEAQNTSGPAMKAARSESSLPALFAVPPPPPPQADENREALLRLFRRLLKWRATCSPQVDGVLFTEDFLCSLLCAVAIVRHTVGGDPMINRSEWLEEAADSSVDEFLASCRGGAALTPAERHRWRVWAAHCVAVAYGVTMDATPPTESGRADCSFAAHPSLQAASGNAFESVSMGQSASGATVAALPGSPAPEQQQQQQHRQADEKPASGAPSVAASVNGASIKPAAATASAASNSDWGVMNGIGHRNNSQEDHNLHQAYQGLRVNSLSQLFSGGRCGFTEADARLVRAKFGWTEPQLRAFGYFARATMRDFDVGEMCADSSAKRTRADHVEMLMKPPAVNLSYNRHLPPLQVQDLLPDVAASWNITNRIAVLFPIKASNGERLVLLTLFDLAGNPVYVSQTPSPDANSAWKIVTSDIGAAKWFTPADAPYIVAAGAFAGVSDDRLLVMNRSAEKTDPNRRAQNEIIERLMRPAQTIIAKVSEYQGLTVAKRHLKGTEQIQALRVLLVAAQAAFVAPTLPEAVKQKLQQRPHHQSHLDTVEPTAAARELPVAAVGSAPASDMASRPFQRRDEGGHGSQKVYAQVPPPPPPSARR